MQNQILIGKNLNYAASKASTTADTATSPELLRDGAIGFYTSTGTLIPADGTGMSTATKFFIAQGTATGCIVTPVLDKRSPLKFVQVQDYTAPVLQVTHIGFNGSAGSLDPAATISKNDEALVKIIETTVGRQTFPKQTYTAILAASETDYGIAHKLAVDINSIGFESDPDGLVVAEVITNGTPAEFDDDPTLVNGSTLVSFANDDTTYGGGSTELAVGDYVRFRGVTYQVVGLPAAGDITLDRPYEGASEAIDVSGTANLAVHLTSITEAGVRLTAKSAGKHFRVAVGGVIEDADIYYTTPFNPGSGTAAQIAALEKEYAAASRGFWNQAGPYNQFYAPTLFADSTATYDMYVIETVNQYVDKSRMDASIGEKIKVVIALHASATSANTALDTITAAI